MRVYVTNLVSDKNNNRVSRLARELGFEEISLISDTFIKEDAYFSYLMEQFSVVESNDVVLVQFPLNQSKELLQLLKEKGANICGLVHEWAEDIVVFEEFKTVFLNERSDFCIKKTLLDAVDCFVEKNMDEDLVHVAFGLHDKTGNYSVWVGVTMQSIIDHTNSKVCFHVLHDDRLSDLNKNKLIDIANKGDCLIQFHLIDINVFDDIASQVKGYTIGSVFRILIPDLLKDLSKVLYLDADLFVNVDIQELWDTDITNYCLGAVRDMNVVNHCIKPLPVSLSELDYSEYFNSGVILMNLNEIRKFGDMKRQIVDYLLEHSKSDLPDQDALNVVYRGRVKFLDPKFNCFVRNLRGDCELKLQDKIYHYVGTECVLYLLNEFDYAYLLTMIKINWGLENVDDRIRYSLGRVNDRISQYEQIVKSSVNQNKVRILCAESYNVDRLYSVFKKRSEDIVIHDLKSLESTILDLKNENRDFIVYLSAGINNSIEYMENHGFKNGVDFFVMQRFLSNLKGGYL